MPQGVYLVEEAGSLGETLMLKTLGFLALFGVLIALTPAPASAAADGARNAQAAVTHDEISARR